MVVHMAKKDKKAKKISAKKEKYLKFRKDKPATMDVSMPELSEEQMRQKREDESLIERFLKFNKKRPEKEIKNMKDRK